MDNTWVLHVQKQNAALTGSMEDRELEGGCPCSQRAGDVQIHVEMCTISGNPENILH
jgi:hypothetical protein